MNHHPDANYFNNLKSLSSIVYDTIYGGNTEEQKLNALAQEGAFPRHWSMSTWVAGILDFVQRDLDDWRPELVSEYVAHQMRIETFQKEFDILADLLRERSVSVVPLKGLWMANSMLPKPGMRVFGDIDIWIDRDQLDAAVDALESMGYIRSNGFELRKKWHFHVSLYKKVADFPVVFEIHWALSRNRLEKGRWEEVWSRTQPSASDRRVKELASYDQVLYLFYHSAHHFFDRPSRVLDVVGATAWFERSSPNSWDKVVELARRYRQDTYFQITLRILTMVLPEKKNIAELIKPSRKVDLLAERIKEQLVSDGRVKSPRWLKFLVSDNILWSIQTALSPSRFILKKWA